MASLFWGQANSEPKRQFRFELSFTSRNGNNPGDIPVWAVKTATKPVAEVSTIPHQYIDHTFNFPGRVTWQPITVTLVDPVMLAINIHLTLTSPETALARKLLQILLVTLSLNRSMLMEKRSSVGNLLIQL